MILASLPMETVNEILSSEPLTKFTNKTITEKAKLLDALNTIRKQGFSVEDEEIEAGVCSVAVPIKNYESQVVAAISVSAFVKKIKDNFNEIVKDLKIAAAGISKELGYQGEKYSSSLKIERALEEVKRI